MRKIRFLCLSGAMLVWVTACSSGGSDRWGPPVEPPVFTVNWDDGNWDELIWQ